MPRARNRLGLPELSTLEAFAVYVVLVVVLSALAYAAGLSSDWQASSIWVALGLVILTPRKRRKQS